MPDHEIQASVTLFGHEALPATLRLRARSTRWRATRAAPPLAGGLLLAPFVALIPPHVPWGLGAALTGLILGSRRWRERYTVEGIEAECPRCGETLSLAVPTRLRVPLSLDCDACRHRPVLNVDEETLPEPGD